MKFAKLKFQTLDNRTRIFFVMLLFLIMGFVTTLFFYIIIFGDLLVSASFGVFVVIVLVIAFVAEKVNKVINSGEK